MGTRRSSITTENPARPSSPVTASRFTRFKGQRIGRDVYPHQWNGRGEWSPMNAGGGTSGYSRVGKSAK
jgi:hypothetical protein